MQNTGAEKIVAPKTVQQQESQISKKEDTVQSLAGDKVSIRVELPKNTVDTLQRMGSLSDLLNSVATSIRQTNEGLKATSNIVNDMKTSLNDIIKSYPPYSLESKERIAQLMSYSSLKKQIISLMVPAPPSPVYEKIKHLWEDLFSGPNNTVQTPTLPLDVPDSHIKAAASQLDNLSSQVGLLQDALGNSVKTV
jgi:archaellum component FlaC